MGTIMWAYASDARVDHVLYLVGNQRIAHRVSDSARRAGIGDRVHVKLLARDGIEGAGMASARVAPRPATRRLKPRGAER